MADDKDDVPAPLDAAEEIPPLLLADNAMMPALLAMSRRIRVQAMQVFGGLGGANGMLKWAKANPTEYYRLLPRLMPKEVEHTPSGTLEDYLEKLEEAKRSGEIIDASPLPSSSPSDSSFSASTSPVTERTNEDD